MDGTVEIPEEIDGLPVCALAPYAFSDGGGRPEDPPAEERKQAPLAGERLQRILLPKTLKSIGRYCFYNCRNLLSLECWGDLRDWGSGAFSGCHRITSIRLHGSAGEESGLFSLLGDLREQITVLFDDAALTYPVFYEEGIENTPARILVDEVHGTGILYRNCFYQKRPDLAAYDALFPLAKAQEGEDLLIRLCLGRLGKPYQLSCRAKAQYEDYVREHLKQAGAFFLSEQDAVGLAWLLDAFSDAPDMVSAARTLSIRAASMHAADLQSILMDFLHRKKSGAETGARLEL